MNILNNNKVFCIAIIIACATGWFIGESINYKHNDETALFYEMAKADNADIMDFMVSDCSVNVELCNRNDCRCEVIANK